MALYGGIELPGEPDLENVRKLDLLPMRPIREMMQYGMAIDIPRLQEISEQLGKEMEELRIRICSEIPAEKLDEFIEKSGMDSEDDYLPMNVESTQQMRKLLFQVLGVGAGRELKLTKGGDISTGKRQLEARKGDHPVVQDTLDYRACAKLKNTYADKLPMMAKRHVGSTLVHPLCWCGLRHEESTWRVHCQIMTTRTKTGRPATKSPNLQNLPVRTTAGQAIRACFVASPGTEMVTVDFSQLELRRLAHKGRVKRMIEVFHRDEDIHTFTAMIAFNIAQDQVDKLLHRAPAKNVNFAVCLLEGQRVLTKRGLVPIEQIRRCDLLWDGIEWVNHDGVICKGRREVISYQGLIATPDHAVWCADGQKLPLGQAMAQGLELAVTGCGSVPIQFEDRRPTVESAHQFTPRHAVECPVCGMRHQEKRDAGKRVERIVRQMQVHGVQICRQVGTVISQTLLCHPRKVFGNSLSGLRELRRAWHQEQVQGRETFCELGARAFAARGLQEGGYWTDQQQWTLRTGQPEIRGPFNQFKQYTPEPDGGIQRGKADSDRSGTETLHGLPGIEVGIHPRSSAVVYRDALGRCVETQGERIVQEGIVYDILNAGPRRRFTCEGKLVSNCYGETARGLYDQLIADTYGKSGIPVPDWLTLAWCEGFMRDWFGIYPEVREYMDVQSYRARRYGLVWTEMGRIRRVPEVRSEHKRVVAEGLRQAGNMGIQGDGADMLKLAQAEAQDWIEQEIRTEGVWCWPLNEVHDELIFEVAAGWGEIVKCKLEEVMSEVLVDKETGENKSRVPIKAEGKVLARWEK